MIPHITEYDTRYHLAFLLVRVGAGVHNALAIGYTLTRDLDPLDSSSLCRVAILISYSMGSSLSSLICATWSEHMGVQATGGVTKSTKDRSGLSLASRVHSTFGSRPESWPCSSRVMLPSPMYI
jgi:hypothetical protein